MKPTLTILTALLLSPLAALHAVEPTPPGDRDLPINQAYPPEAFYHNGKGGRVLDVTKPPFNAKGDGKTDDTKALCDAMRFVRDHYEDLAGEGYSHAPSSMTGIGSSTCPMASTLSAIPSARAGRRVPMISRKAGAMLAG